MRSSVASVHAHSTDVSTRSTDMQSRDAAVLQCHHPDLFQRGQSDLRCDPAALQSPRRGLQSAGSIGLHNGLESPRMNLCTSECGSCTLTTTCPASTCSNDGSICQTA